MIRPLAVAAIISAISIALPAQARCERLARYSPPKLPRSGAVRMLLPRSLPASAGPVRSVAILQADGNGYYIGYSTVRGCGGALSCAHVHVAGHHKTSHTFPTDSHNLHVRLGDGTPAMYRPPDCSGASCTEGSLIFERAGAVYEIDADLARDDLPILRCIYATMSAPESMR